MQIPQKSTKFAKVVKQVGITAVFTTAVNAQTLLHHWKLDGDALDSIGDANGTLEGDAVFTTGSSGQFGEALSLDGDGDALRTLASPVPAVDYTLTAWVFWDGEAISGSRGTIAGGQNSGNEGEVFTMSRSADGTDRKLFLNLLPNGGQGGSITESPDDTISTGVWHHVAYSLSSTEGVTLYLDGAVVQTNPTRTEHTPSSLANFTIGARPDSVTANPGWFDGLIDDVAIFDGVLTSAQLASVMNSGAAVFGPNSAPLTLQITPADGTFTFEWNSRDGLQYDLVSSTDLSTDPSTWLPHDDGVNPVYENIASSGTGTNSLPGVIGNGPTHFFALIEKPQP